MKRNILIGIAMLLALGLVTGCGCSKKESVPKSEGQTVIDDQIFEGLEFVNAGASDGVITTVLINNTGVTYEGSKFSIKIMDENGNVIVELIDEVKEEMETGTTKTIETKTDADLSKAVSIEYSILSK